MVQNAGQVEHPSGMWARSRTITESSYDLYEEIRILSRPLEFVGTTFVSSARITNLLLEAGRDHDSLYKNGLKTYELSMETYRRSS